MTLRLLDGVMAALFAFALAVQFNDPDPLRWLALYAAAGGITLVVAIRKTVPVVAAAALGVASLAWALFLTAGVPGLEVYLSMFDAWEMRSQPVELAREASGLIIVALWMAVLTGRAWMGGR